ncbi:hypothetical protein CFR71_01705 [Novacetimonas pomaceti]|uniref:Uncharacterized protein n=1 Tax=Novacetimonas pomaceti TaxID=2021998 RepID=A0A318QID8_9PROT|nr:hypothetical protein CFR71_01705 [Novacetimonas pomaceti]
MFRRDVLACLPSAMAPPLPAPACGSVAAETGQDSAIGVSRHIPDIRAHTCLFRWHTKCKNRMIGSLRTGRDRPIPTLIPKRTANCHACAPYVIHPHTPS